MANKRLKTVTDETFREARRHGNAEFPFGYYSEDVYAFDLHCIDWHWHNEIEIVYAEKGNIACCVGTDGFLLSQGCGLLVNSGVLHRYEATENVCMPNIVFAPELLGNPSGAVFAKYIRPIAESSTQYIIFQPIVEWQNELLKTLREIFSAQNADNPSELQTTKLLLVLWNTLYDNLPFLSEPVPQSKETRHRTLLQRMMQFIHARYHEKITLGDISSSVYISKNSALQIFKTGLRISPITYLIRYRLKRAAEILATTDKTVATVADETGFADAGYFCRKFKELYKLPPTEYRNKAEYAVEKIGSLPR